MKDDRKKESQHHSHRKNKKRSRSTSSSSGSSSRHGHHSSYKKDKKAKIEDMKDKNPKGTIKDEKNYDTSIKYDLTKDVQSEWTSSDEFLDTNIDKGLALTRIAKTTEFSQKNGTAGKDIRTVRLIDICYQGIKNHNIRSISAGRFINIIFTKSIKENQFITKLIYNMRPE